MIKRETLFKGRVFTLFLDGEPVEINEEHQETNELGLSNWSNTITNALNDHCERHPK